MTSVEIASKKMKWLKKGFMVWDVASQIDGLSYASKCEYCKLLFFIFIGTQGERDRETERWVQRIYAMINLVNQGGSMV